MFRPRHTKADSARRRLLSCDFDQFALLSIAELNLVELEIDLVFFLPLKPLANNKLLADQRIKESAGRQSRSNRWRRSDQHNETTL